MDHCKFGKNIKKKFPLNDHWELTKYLSWENSVSSIAYKNGALMDNLF